MIVGQPRAQSGEQARCTRRPVDRAPIGKTASEETTMEHVAEWDVHVYLFEHDDDSTYARAVLKTGAGTLIGEGSARRNPADVPVAEIGDELAVGRALVSLGEQLLNAAAGDIAAIGSTRSSPRGR
jgi:hypothetical protein